MTGPLLTTKLHIPPVRAELVPRPRLLEQLNAGLGQNGFDNGNSVGFARKLTLVSAPAGFGKTTLLSEWIHRRDGSGELSTLPVAWIALDEGDNDPTRFLTYVVAALQTVEVRQEADVDVGQGMLSALQSPQPPPTESILTALVNEIATIPDPIVLVLDDYHVIKAQPIHDVLQFLLDHLPFNMHLIVATRSDPPLHLARLRGRGQLIELRAPDLRFTSEEAATFLNGLFRLDLAPEHVEALTARTEGWIASLQMAALSMQGRGLDDVSGFVQAFTGSHRFILDYLVEEVLDQQPLAVQEFLLKTSILERLSAPLCHALCSAEGNDQDGAQVTLERLEKANLFIVPLDDQRRWYRYHRLFADLLHARLRQRMGAEGIASLHRQASEWYQGNGLMAEAIEHASSAGDFERAADLIDQAAEAVWMRSEIATFLNWAEALPDDVLLARPRLCIFQAWGLLLSGHPLEAIETRVQEVIQADTAGDSAGEVTLLRALIAVYQGDTRQCAVLAHRALELLPEKSTFLRSLVAGVLGLAEMYSGDVLAATVALEEAARVSQQAGNLFNVVLALCHLAELCYLQGQLHGARARYEQALDAAIDDRGHRQPIACRVLIGLGELWREWNDLEAATRYLEKGIELASKCGAVWALSGHIVLARVKQAQGDTAGAREEIQTARQIAVKFDATELDDLQVAVYQAFLWVAQGNVEGAARWAEERGLDQSAFDELGEESRRASAPFLYEFELNTLARVYLAQGRPDAALKVLGPLLQKVEAAGWTLFVIQGSILASLAHQVRGDVTQALDVLERALCLAEPEGYARIFVDEGEPMARLLRRAVSKGIAPEYAEKLLAAFEPKKENQRRTAKPSSSPVVRPVDPRSGAERDESLIEPLSERELQVLRFLTTHLTSTEIAEELFIAASTVRSHIKSIYSKLGVHSRADAVQRGKELGLL